MTTSTSFDSTLSGLSITGVTRAYTYEKLTIHTPDLPASYVRLPGAATNLDTATTCSGDGFTLTEEHVVVMEPLGQGTQSLNHTAALTMLDSIRTAMKTLYTSSLFVFESNVTVELVGEVQHWVIVTSCQLTE